MNRALPVALMILPCLIACSSPAPSGGTSAPGAEQLPCDVAAVVQQKCLFCHSAVLALGAPISLVNYADTQADRGGQPVWKAMQSAVDSGRMPAFGSLTAEQKGTLDRWFAAGAPSGAACKDGSKPGAGADGSGIVTLGDTNINIPAGRTDFTITKTCSALSKSGEPVMIVSAIPHMHGLGTDITTEHFRNGVSLGFISKPPLGTFKWEDFEATPYGHEYMPGDTLVTTCHYDNPNSFAVGYPAEMCYNFLIVTPISGANGACTVGEPGAALPDEGTVGAR